MHRRTLKKNIIPWIALSGLVGMLNIATGQTTDNKIKRKSAGNFPISTIVEVPASATTYYLSGVVPNKDETGTYSKTTEMQTINVMRTIEKNLQSYGLTLADVVKMQVFLVGDPKLEGKMDFAGFMKGYTQFFGTETQPKTPARSVFQVSGLANPDFLVEIEVIAAKVPK